MERENNFRVRVAREKREKMRTRLLEATIDLHGALGRGRTLMIDDIIRKAGTSRGTFYKYFPSVEAVIDELGRAMADEMLHAMNLVFAGLSDPAARAAMGPLMPLIRAAMQPRWAAFTSRVDYVEFLEPWSTSGKIVEGELLHARNAGVLAFDSLDAALDLVVGATVEGTRRVATHGQGADYARELCAMMLRGLGMEKARARSAVDEAWRMLLARHAQLPWWRDGFAAEDAASLPEAASAG